MKFTVLCIDNNETVKSKSIISLIYAFKANDTLWSGNIHAENNEIKYEDNSLSLKIEEYDTSKFAVGERCTPAYTITVESSVYDKIEPFRMKLIDHLNELSFSHIRILKDDVSKNIACKLYPLIYSIENQMREFITSSLLKKIGVDFWQYVVDKSTRDKANGLKDNEPHFIGSNKVIGDVMLLYFDALGKIAYGETTVFTQSKDILEKVRTAKTLEELQKELLEGNFQKHFKDCFEKSDFQNKWTRLNLIRNKVAHNSYFIHSDLVETEKLTEDLSKIITGAYEKLDLFKLSVSDMEALKKAIDDNIREEISPTQYEKNDKNDSETENKGEKPFNIDTEHDLYKSIDENTLLNILREVSASIPFVGLKYFVKDILGNKGYSYNSSYTLINILIEKGILKTEKEINPTGGYETTSIRIIN